MNAHQAERNLLGALLITDKALPVVSIDESLRADHFAAPSHRAIYAAMCAVGDSGESFDREVIAARLGPNHEALEVLRTLGDSASLRLVRSYARVIRDAFTQREVQRVAQEALAALADGSMTPRELLDRLESEAMAIGGDTGAKQARNIADVMAEETERIHKISTGETVMTGVPSGFDELDDITGGFQPGNLVIIAARPAMGKSAFVTNVGEHAAVNGHTTLTFGMEMTEGEVAQRLMAAGAHVQGEALRRGTVQERHWPRIMEAGARMAKHKFLIDDSSDLSITELRAKARRVHQKTPLGMVIVDYLQLMRARPGENRVAAVGEMSRGLKIMAKELQVPVLALSQLSRALESRGTDIKSKKPQLSDLRESGQIEQDADLVLFLFREDYYDKETDRKDLADVIVAKHRGGRLGDVELGWLPEYLRFVNRGPTR